MAATSEQEMELDEDFPTELRDRVAALDNALSNSQKIFEPLISTPLNVVHEKLTTLDKAKLDLLGAYAINSLFWMYLNVKGQNPKEHAVKQELDRIKSYMGRVKEIQDKAKAPRVNKDASKRFVRNALWDLAHKKASGSQQEAEGENPRTESQEDGPTPSKVQKTEENRNKKHKSKHKKN